VKNLTKITLIAIVFFFLGVISEYVICNNSIKTRKGSDEIIRELSKDSNSPFKYDSKSNKYTIEYKTVKRGKSELKVIPLHYCPITGRKLTALKISGNLGGSFEREMQRVFSLLKSAATLNDIEEIFGKPDQIYHNVGNDKTQYLYENISDELTLLVHESKSGKLDFTCGQK